MPGDEAGEVSEAGEVGSEVGTRRPLDFFVRCGMGMGSGGGCFWREGELVVLRAIEAAKMGETDFVGGGEAADEGGGSEQQRDGEEEEEGCRGWWWESSLMTSSSPSSSSVAWKLSSTSSASSSSF